MLPPPLHNIILFAVDFNVQIPLLRLLQFLIDLKSTIRLIKVDKSYLKLYIHILVYIYNV